jgi:hypothetical protein
LVFPAPASSSVFEANLNEDGEESNIVDEKGSKGWDDLVLEDKNEESVA